MDISKVTDMDKLKALAYDTLQVIEAQQNNLRIIQQRMIELQQQEEQKKK